MDKFSDFLSACEREVVLTMSDDEKMWTAYVSSRRMMSKFEKAKWECTKVDKDKNGNIIAKTYTAPLKRVLIRGELPKREYTDEEREILRKRAYEMLAKKNKKEE